MTRLDRLEKLLAEARAAMPEWREQMSAEELETWSNSRAQRDVATINLDEALRASAVSLLAVARAAEGIANDAQPIRGILTQRDREATISWVVAREPIEANRRALEPLLAKEAGNGA